MIGHEPASAIEPTSLSQSPTSTRDESLRRPRRDVMCKRTLKPPIVLDMTVRSEPETEYNLSRIIPTTVET